MDLNDHIKSIIYTYYTYTNKQIEEFKKDWIINIKKVNKLFDINFNDYTEKCFFCIKKDHCNSDCPKFYMALHNINTIGKKN